MNDKDKKKLMEPEITYRSLYVIDYEPLEKEDTVEAVHKAKEIFLAHFSQSPTQLMVSKKQYNDLLLYCNKDGEIFYGLNQFLGMDIVLTKSSSITVSASIKHERFTI